MLLGINSCQSDLIEIPDSEQFTRDFVKRFGVTDIDETWNSAKRVNAEIDAAVLSGATRVEVLTGWPGAADARLLARYDAADASSFSFDAPQGASSVYVRVLDASGRVLADRYVAVRNAAMNMNDAAATPVKVHLYDLTDSPAFGSALVTDRNRQTWLDFTDHSGNKVYESTQPVLHYPDFTPLSLKANPTKTDDSSTWTDMPADGLEIGNYDAVAMVQAPATLSPASEASEVEVAVRVRRNSRSENSWSNVQLTHGGAGDWNNFGNFDLNCATGDEATATFTLKGSDASIFTATGARIQGSNITVLDVKFRELAADPDNLVRYADVFHIYGLTEAPVSDLNGYMSSYLKPDNSFDEAGYSAADLVPLVGKNGVFHEEVDGNNICNLDKYRNLLGLDKGVEYRVSENSTVGINFFFGVASYFNSLGYFYYNDGEENDIAALLRKPKFILISNAYPGNNIKFSHGDSDNPDFRHEPSYQDIKNSGQLAPAGDYEGGKGDEGKDMSDSWNHPSLPKRLVDHVDPEINGPEVQGYTGRMQSAYYPLTYYSIKPDGTPDAATATQVFPAGTHIAFFMIQGGHYWIDRNGSTSQCIDNVRLAFSLPQLNEAIGNTFHTSHSHSMHADGYSIVSSVGGDIIPWTPFASYLWNGKIVMGVEDMPCEPGDVFLGGDHDMNDLLFNVSGNVVREEDKEMNPNKPEPMSWIVACEDLGATDDFDFNDVVFGVKHAAGDSCATVTALASGGTLPVYLVSKYPQLIGGKEVTNKDGILIPECSIDGEFHSWWGPDKQSTQMLNTYDYSLGRGAEVTISVPKDFSLSTAGDADSAKPTHGRPADGDEDMGGFKVVVVKDDKTSNTITAPKYDRGFEAPQMFLVPAEWQWPVERQIITGVYGGFIDFGDGWWLKKDGQQANRRIRHDWK